MLAYKNLGLCFIPENFKKTFDNLRPDPYLKDKKPPFRFRSYQHAIVSGEKLILLPPNEKFYQSKEINSYSGGIYRVFPPIEQKTVELVFSSIITKIMKILPEKKYSIGIHQIRIVTNDDKHGLPAPEGIHHDGFKYVAICCVSLHNVSGGDTTLIPCDGMSSENYTFKIPEGEVFIFNDVSFSHYTSAIVPLLPGEGYRDVFVITFDENQVINDTFE